MHIFQCLTLYSFKVFNSVSVCLVYMNECLLTFKMWDTIQTIYTADYAPTSCASCLHHSLSPSAHSLCAARTLAHGPPPSSPHRPGLSHFWLQDRSFPFLGRFTCPPHLANSYPILKSQLKWHHPSLCPPPPSKLVPPVGSLFTPFFYFCGCLPAHNQLTSESSAHQSHMEPGPAVVTTESPALSKVSRASW